LRPGYKQTDAGVIPEAWETTTIATACVAGGLVRGPFGGTLKKDVLVSAGKKVYEQKNAIQHDATIGSYFIDEAKFRELQRFALAPGDFIVSCAGTIGRIFRVPADAQPGVINQALLKLRTDDSVVLSDYFYHYFRWGSFQQRIVDNTHGGAMQNLVGMPLFRSVELARPPLPEQRAIAAALSDVDALLDGLDRLIAKKRDLKQAAMQQLLTGQTRLPGFHGEWEVKRLGELFVFSGGYSASRDQLSEQGHCYLHYGDIHGSSKTTVDTNADFQDIPKLDVSLNRVSRDSLLEDGDVVFVDASEDNEGTSKHLVVINKDCRPFISGLHTIVAKARTEELAHEYRRYCFQTAAIRQQFLFYAVGTKVSGISKTNIVKLALPVPSVPEQTAIAAVLSDMDAELEALEARRDKTRALKQGMMQELLTGRTRLV
jgi:type I restriction enzyme S subunit